MKAEMIEALITQVAQAFAARPAPSSVREPDDEDVITDEEIERIWDAYQGAMHQLAVVAAALGACTCLGRDFACRQCAGLGTPGSEEPDEAAFQALVGPLIARHPALFRSSRSPRPQNQQRRGGSDGRDVR